MDKTVLIEQTSKRLKRWELIVTAMLFLALFAGFGLLYVAIPVAVVAWRFRECVYWRLLPSGSQFGGITDKCKKIYMPN